MALVIGTADAWAEEGYNNSADFSTWLEAVKERAVESGVSRRLAEEALDLDEPDERVIELDGKQPEKSITMEEYLERTLSAERIESGRKAYHENSHLLAKAAKKYGVAAEYIVALWGIETSYGKVTGGFEVVPSLASLAYEGRRREFFTDELIDALKIVDAGHVGLHEMTGSWAGAMGQCQFMPSSFLKFAADGNNDGREDIWGAKADVFASIANYLSKSGWLKDERLGIEVTVPDDFDAEMKTQGSRELLRVKKTVAEWEEMGVRKASGADFTGNERAREMSLIMPSDDDKSFGFLAGDNFRTVLKWNRSVYFALAVEKLSRKIKGLN